MKRLFATGALLLTGQAMLFGAVINLHWGGLDVVTTSPDLTLGTPSDGTTYRYYNQSTQAITANLTGYNALPLYAYLQNNDTRGATNFSVAKVVHSSEGDYVRLDGAIQDLENRGQRSIVGLIYLKKEDFLGPAHGSASLSFADNTPLTANIRQLNAGLEREVRFAVLNDGQWYVSVGRQTGATLFTLADPLAGKWTLWDPDTAPLSALPTGGNHLGSDFQNIQAFGLAFLNVQATTSNSSPLFQLSTLGASFEAIPEPSGLALLAGGSLLCWWVARQRRTTKALQRS